jgi:hypothetical protein
MVVLGLAAEGPGQQLVKGPRFLDVPLIEEVVLNC